MGFVIVKWTIKTNQHIIREQCMRNHDCVPAGSESSLEKLSLEAFEHKVCMGQKYFFSGRYKQWYTLLD